MTTTERPQTLQTGDPTPPGAAEFAAPPVLAAVLVGMTSAALYRQGAVSAADALGIATVSLGLTFLACGRRRLRSQVVPLAMVGALAVWWLARAGMEHDAVAFLPFGASLLGFLAAFTVVRSLGTRERSRVMVAVVALGAASAALGVAEVLERWSGTAGQVSGRWRVSATLVAPSAAAALLAVAVLVAIALDVRKPLVRMSVCLCLGGLIGTQERWELLALAIGATLVPWRRWRAAAWPLATGVLLGMVVLASESSGGRTWWAVAAASGVLVASTGTNPRRRAPVAWAAAVGLLAVASCLTALLVVRHDVGPSQPGPADQAQSTAWTDAAQTWRTSPVTGVGPSRPSTTGGRVDAAQGLPTDGSLQVVAQGGLVGAVLLVGVMASVAATVRRRDLVSTCATAATVTFALAGVVGIAWQVPALACVGGAAAGLAALPAAGRARDDPGPPVPSRQKALSGRAAAVTAAVVVVVAVTQLSIGIVDTSGTALSRGSGLPLPVADPQAPGRTILASPDASDPFMLRTGGRYVLYPGGGTGSMNVPVRTATRLGVWGQPVEALPHLPAWATSGFTWAPDVSRVRGGWALYFTALVRGAAPLTHCIGAAFSSSPVGPFRAAPSPLVCQLDHRGSIDPRVFADPSGHLTLLWKSDDNANPGGPGPDQNGQTGIFAQPLAASGRVLLGSPVSILSPSQPWEGSIVEGPDMVEAWGTYWLIFSGNWFNTPSYALGVAACQSPTGPCADANPSPFLSSNRQGAGPGESSLFKDGAETFLLYLPYHADPTQPWPTTPRPVSMVRLGFEPSGPYLATP